MKLFYGWVIVAVGIVVGCIAMGGVMSLGVFLQYGSVSGKNLQIPVLNNSASAYKNLGPSPLPTHTPTPTPTATLTPTPTPTN